MKYKLIKWNFRNMGVIGYIKSLIMKPVEISVELKKCDNYVDVEYRHDGKKAMLVKANGLEYVDFIRKSLQKKGVNVEEYDIEDYNALMWNIFIKVADKELSAWEKINNTFYADEKGKACGKAYILPADVDMDMLERLKRRLRRKIGVKMFRVTETMNDGTVEVFKTSITPLHVPDRKRMEREYSLIYQFRKAKNESYI